MLKTVTSIILAWTALDINSWDRFSLCEIISPQTFLESGFKKCFIPWVISISNIWLGLLYLPALKHGIACIGKLMLAGWVQSGSIEEIDR